MLPIPKLLGFLGGIHKYVTLGLLVALAFTYWQWDHASLRLAQQKQKTELSELGRKNDRLAYAKAQEEAKVKSLNKVIEVERKRNEEARKADEAYTSLLNRYNASIVRYQASQRPSAGINMSSTSVTSSGSDFSSESTQISITIEDAGICAENTARLKAAHEWAGKLGLED